MPPKQKKNPTRKKSNPVLSEQKKPKDVDEHLTFSITKDAVSGEDYKKIRQEPSHKRAKKSTKKVLDKNFLEILENSIDEVGEHLIKPKKARKSKPKKRKEKYISSDLLVHKLQISTKSYKRSPYVVDLLEKSITEEEAPLKNKTKVKKENPSQAWLKEVERMRKQASVKYKDKINNIQINFLGKSKPKKLKLKNINQGFNFKNLAKTILSFLERAVKAILNWIFEFFLSIPLGFLLFFQVLLKIVEVGNVWIVKGAISFSKGVSWTVEQLILSSISILKGIIIIPIKLITIVLLLIYKTLSSLGLFIVSFGNAVVETITNYLKPFSNPPKHFYKKIFAIGIISGIVVVSVKAISTAPYQIRAIEGKVLGVTKEGFSALSGVNESISQGQVTAASENWDLAGEKFSQAKDNIDSLNILVRGAIKLLPQGKDGMRAIQAGEDLAQAGQYITEAIAPFVGQEPSDLSVVDIISNLSLSLNIALPYISSARTHIDSIDPESLPEAYKEKFLNAQNLLPDVENAVRDFNDLADSLNFVIGGNGAKRYAVLFQNNNELRPAGGFIGSLAFVDVHNGEIKNIEIPGGGSYDFQGSMSKHVESPRPLWLLNPHWELQDSNWYPDWPTSAEKVAWFIESASQPSVDGVIAIQATTFVELLKVLGPIEFEEYGVTLNSENVLDEIQYEVEVGYDKKENKPKKYIAELAPRILDKILKSNSKELFEVISLMKTEIVQKNILLYFRDKKVNQEFLDRGWEPTIVESEMDYLSVIHANVGGGKTDGVIAEDWVQKINIDEEGNAIAELTIRRRHNGDPNHLFESYNNVDFARAYVPKGSELISFTGVKIPPATMFEQPKDFYAKDSQLLAIEGKVIVDEATGTRVTQDFGKTVFGNWLQVDPGNILVSKVKYKLPFKIKPYDVLNPDVSNGYSLLIQKQAGARSIPYIIELQYPWQWNVSWSASVGNGEVKELGPGLTMFKGELSQDSGFAVMFEE
jgi:hypothetical protein